MRSDNKPESNQLFINIKSHTQEEKEEEEDAEELERITNNLRNELNELDSIESVDFLINKDSEIPKGAKAGGGEIAVLGSMLITLGASAGSTVIPTLVNTLQSWLRRNERRKISLEIGGDKLEITGASDKDQQRLIDTWISSHTAKGIDNKVK